MEGSIKPEHSRNARPPFSVASQPSSSKKRRSTLRVIREHGSSISSAEPNVIEPTENTSPPLGVSKWIISAPPSSGFSPFATSYVEAGEQGLTLSVSCPDAPSPYRSCNVLMPKRSPRCRPVPAKTQCSGSTTL